jgi:hypothetical protein
LSALPFFTALSPECHRFVGSFLVALALRNFSRSIGFETLGKESLQFLAFCSILALRRGKVFTYRTFRPAFAE